MRSRPLAFVADRNERRNITIGQKAMGYAILFPDPELAEESGAKGGRGNRGLSSRNAFSEGCAFQRPRRSRSFGRWRRYSSGNLSEAALSKAAPCWLHRVRDRAQMLIAASRPCLARQLL